MTHPSSPHQQPSHTPTGRDGQARSIRWARHEGDRYWHAIGETTSTGSVVTFCNGRWPVDDEVETSAMPGHEWRCECCSRAMIEVRRIDLGLDDLAAVEVMDLRVKVAMTEVE
jgi:hypothetical protein